jgi:hypothetical protein
VSNRGALTGELSVLAFNEAGATCELEALGTVAPHAVSVLSGAIKAGLQERCPGFLPDGSGRVAITITVTARADDIEVYSAYDDGSDRGVVVNDGNGRRTLPPRD